MLTIEQINTLIIESDVDTDEISDEFHTFGELYDIRMILNALLFNILAQEPKKYRVTDICKSYRHNDGNLCFGGGWFIVLAVINGSQISFHYPAIFWEMFSLPIVEKVTVQFDGHQTGDVIKQLALYNFFLFASASEDATAEIIKRYKQYH